MDNFMGVIFAGFFVVAVVVTGWACFTIAQDCNARGGVLVEGFGGMPTCLVIPR